MFDLQARRIEKGVTQEKLAAEAGVTRQAISAFERGLSKPTVQTAKKIGKILDVDWVVFYEDSVESNSAIS